MHWSLGLTVFLSACCAASPEDASSIERCVQTSPECADGGDCPDVIASGMATGFTSLAIDQSAVYWITADRAIWAAPKQGGTPKLLAAAQVVDCRERQPYALALDDTYVYWVLPTTGRVMRVPKNGGSASALATGESRPTILAADEIALYWGDARAQVLRKADKASGDIETIAELPGVPKAMALDDAFVYVTTVGAETAALVKTPKNGGASTVLATGDRAWFGPVQVDDMSVFWAAEMWSSAGERTAGQLLAAPKVGGPANILVQGQYFVQSMAIDDSRLYWIADGRALTASKTGGAPAALIADINDPLDHVVVDASTVYWTSGRDDCSVLRAPK